LGVIVMWSVQSGSKPLKCTSNTVKIQIFNNNKNNISNNNENNNNFNPKTKQQQQQQKFKYLTTISKVNQAVLIEPILLRFVSSLSGENSIKKR